jgi:hypothetical protein
MAAIDLPLPPIPPCPAGFDSNDNFSLPRLGMVFHFVTKSAYFFATACCQKNIPGYKHVYLMLKLDTGLFLKTQKHIYI